MVAMAARPADPPAAACPACGAGPAHATPTAFADPLLFCTACDHRWVVDPAGREPPAGFYDDLHEKGLINPLPDDVRRDFLDERLRLIEEWRRPGALLDVGCGDGAFLARAEARGWTTAGLETSAEAAARARASVRGPILGMPLEQAALASDFDVVTFWDCLEHLVDPAAALRRVAARMRTGGVLAITMPNAAGTESRLWGRRWPYLDLGRYGHLHHFTPRSLRRLVERAAGASRIDVRTYGSVDLRYVPALAPIARAPGGGWALDKASGLLARTAVPRGLGSTLLMRAQLPSGRAAGS
jgi:SAM-dependent methyltransferase